MFVKNIPILMISINLNEYDSVRKQQPWEGKTEDIIKILIS